MNNSHLNKAQEIFFWVVTVVISLIGFVYSYPGLPFQTVPVTFPRETLFFTMSAVAICFAALKGSEPLRGHKRTAFFLLAAFVVWSILASLWTPLLEGHSRRLAELVFFCGWAFALSSILVPIKKVEILSLWMGFVGGLIGFAVAGGRLAMSTSFGTWPFGNANAAGMFCAFAAVLNTGLVLRGLRKYEFKDPRIIVALMCLLMALAGLGVTQSKGAFVGFIIGEAALGWTFIQKYRIWIALGAFLVLATATSGYLIKHDWDVDGTTVGFRVKAYEASLRQIGAAPIGGTGMGTFYAYFPQYSLPELSGHPKMGDTVFHAHSNILEIGTELGIVGMLLYSGLIVFLCIVPILKKQKPETGKISFNFIWIACLLAISTHALVAVHFYWTETVLYFWTCVGVLLALGRTKEKKIKLNKRIPALVILIISLVGLWYVGVYQEFIGRMHVASREKDLNLVRKYDKEFELMGRRGMSNSPKFKGLRKKRISLYSSIIRDLNEELHLVHMQRMRSDTYYQLGSAYYNVGYPREALHFFRLVVQDAPGYVNTDYFIGRAYDSIRRKSVGKSSEEKQELLNRAIKALEKYLHANIRSKMSGEATIFLANLYVQRNQHVEAIRAINRHLEFKPETDRRAELLKLRNNITADLARIKNRSPK